MLVVLLLVVFAAGALVAAVMLHTPELAWCSLLLTALSGVLLLVLERRRRRRAGGSKRSSERSSGRHRVRWSTADTGSRSTVPPGESVGGRGPRSSEPVGSFAGVADSAAASTRGGTATMSGAPAESAGAVGIAGRAAASASSDPGVERVTAGVRSRAQLNARVLVVDERPRYHLETCPWLTEQAGPQPMGLTVEKAHELGFTPCARCGPDEHVARRYGDA